MRLAPGIATVCALIAGYPACSTTDAATAFEPPPGAALRSPNLVTRLERALTDLGSEYEPRTRHLGEGGNPRFVNRLILETSPYLLQHAHNPVDWRPWGAEAFEEAKRSSRPVLLSVGYSTCHWCHVMERESFEDLEVARFINQHYVAIKVDREERPDLDAIYMSAVQMIAGRGGWPMTLWLTPDAKPFYAGTYIPPRDGDRGASVGFLTLLQRIHAAYRDSQPEVMAAGDRLSAAIKAHLEGAGATPGELPPWTLVERAVADFAGRFDSRQGGSLGAPKFPSHTPVRLLLRHHHRSGDLKSLEMAVTTLERMAAGGIHDQLGGGFHRYSTDEHWLVPHFEKMLYDNALLAVAYLEAWQLTERTPFAVTARRTLDYVAREMTADGGGFYSATDADSSGPDGHEDEGPYFTWTPAELEIALGPERARIVAAYFGVSPAGNFEGRSILHRLQPVEAVAESLGRSARAVEEAVEAALPTLYEYRRHRRPPLLDDKILTAWNGLMISAFARAATAFDEPAYLDHATRAADFLCDQLWVDGRLLRSWRAGVAANPAVLEDYAFLIAGLLDLYEAGGDRRWIRRARELQGELDRSYAAPDGAYYRTTADTPLLLARELPARDGARPSGNSVAALNLLRLSEFTSDDTYRQTADRLFAALAHQLAQTPAAGSELLVALDFRYQSTQEIVLVGERPQDLDPFLDRMATRFAPHQVLITVASAEAPSPDSATLLPLAAGKDQIDGLPTAYVCERGVCQLPTTDFDIFLSQLEPEAGAHPPVADARKP